MLFALPLIYQAFNEPFRQVESELEALHAQGYTHVQISPPQKSAPIQDWYGRYQPLDFSQIESPLGNENDLHSLTAHARAAGMEVIADTVFNHMANEKYAPGLHYAQFGPQDFHFPDTQPCITNWSDRYQETNYWLCLGRGQGLPDLDTESPHVFQVEHAYLQKLVSLGIRGVRLDAAKHMPPEYLARLFKGFGSTLPFVYGEVIGSSIAESELYTGSMRVTDFALLGQLIEAFSSAGDMRTLGHIDGILDPAQALVFAANHDTTMNPAFFNFDSRADQLLAGAFLIARAGEAPVAVFSGDARERSTLAAIAFARATRGEGPTRFPRVVPASKDLLWLSRGDAAFALIYKGESPWEAEGVEAPGLRDGTYREVDGAAELHVRGGRIIEPLSLSPKSARFFTAN